MRVLIALFIPWLSFITIGRPIAAIICLLLQLSFFGWLPATLWAIFAIGSYKGKQSAQKETQKIKI